MPQGLTGTEAEQWADRRMVELLPMAIAEFEYLLRYGDEAQRERAASKVLDANGRGKREAMMGGSQPIIILTGVNPSSVPWAQTRPAQVIDVQTVSAPAPERAQSVPAQRVPSSVAEAEVTDAQE